MQRDKMKAAIDIIYDKIFNEGRGDLLPGLVAGPYIQHNPMFPDGTDFMVNFLTQAKKVPCEVKRIAIDGDLAFIHVRYLDWGGKEAAGVDSEIVMISRQPGLPLTSSGKLSRSRAKATFVAGGYARRRLA